MYGEMPGENHPSPKQIDLYGYNGQLNTNIGKRNGIIFVGAMRLGHNLASTKWNVLQERLDFQKYIILIISLNNIKERLDGCFGAVLVENMAKVLVFSGRRHEEQLINTHIQNK